MDQLHLLAGDVDQLVVLRVQGSAGQETVLGELAQGYQPFAVGIPGLAHAGMVVPGLVVHVEFLADVVDLLSLVGRDRVLDVPLADLAVDEQGGVGIAPPVEGRVQRTQAQLGLGDHRIPRVLELAREPVVDLPDGDHRDRGGQLAIGDEVLSVRRGVQAVRALGNGDVQGQIGAVAAVQHRHPGVADGGVLPGLDGSLDARDVEHHRPVTLVAHGLGKGDAFLGVVAGRAGILAVIVGIGVV